MEFPWATGSLTAGHNNASEVGTIVLEGGTFTKCREHENLTGSADADRQIPDADHAETAAHRAPTAPTRPDAANGRREPTGGREGARRVRVDVLERPAGD